MREKKPEDEDGMDGKRTGAIVEEDLRCNGRGEERRREDGINENRAGDKMEEKTREKKENEMKEKKPRDKMEEKKKGEENGKK